MLMRKKIPKYWAQKKSHVILPAIRILSCFSSNRTVRSTISGSSISIAGLSFLFLPRALFPFAKMGGEEGAEEDAEEGLRWMLWWTQRRAPKWALRKTPRRTPRRRRMPATVQFPFFRFLESFLFIFRFPSGLMSLLQPLVGGGLFPLKIVSDGSMVYRHTGS